VTPDLDYFRQALEDERARLRYARDGINHDGSLADETGDLALGPGDHLADHATETFMRELDGGLEENADHLLAEIDAALARIDAGTYGTCVVCGRTIDEERLRAVPYATLCIDDKRAQEQR
jgi:RNA polymerase-binding protein DksA